MRTKSDSPQCPAEGPVRTGSRFRSGGGGQRAKQPCKEGRGQQQSPHGFNGAACGRPAERWCGGGKVADGYPTRLIYTQMPGRPRAPVKILEIDLVEGVTSVSCGDCLTPSLMELMTSVLFCTNRHAREANPSRQHGLPLCLTGCFLI